MDTNNYNCIIIDTYTDIFPILVAGRVLTLTHLAAKDNFEDARTPTTHHPNTRKNREIYKTNPLFLPPPRHSLPRQ